MSDMSPFLLLFLYNQKLSVQEVRGNSAENRWSGSLSPKTCSKGDFALYRDHSVTMFMWWKNGRKGETRVEKLGWDDGYFANFLRPPGEGEKKGCSDDTGNGHA